MEVTGERKNGAREGDTHISLAHAVFCCTYFFQGSATLARKERISCALDAQWPCEEEGKGKDSSPSFTPELPPPLLFPTPPTEATLVVLPIMTCAGRFCRKGCLFRKVKEGWDPKS